MKTATVKAMWAHLPHARVQWQDLRLRLAVRYAGGRGGRVLLHILCACGDRQFRWHLNGIVRELAAEVTLLDWRSSEA